MRSFFIIFLTFLPLWGMQQSITVNMENPEYRDGIISTNHGGVITSTELRIQARHIVYINKIENGKFLHKVSAEGDLMLHNKGRTYVGHRFEYDFITKSGIIYNGVTAINPWFLCGEQIYLHTDNSLHLYNTCVTTSEKPKPNWQIHVPEAHITKDHLLAAKNVTFRVMNTPIFWIPFFKSNLKLFTRSPIHYTLRWGREPYPTLDILYRIYSWEQLDFFVRFNIHALRKLGVSFESNYHSIDKKSQFLTKSFVDYDRRCQYRPEKHAPVHYHLRGVYKTQNEQENCQFFASYNWLSDKNMQKLFNNDTSELKNVRQTQIKVRNYQDWMIFGVNGRARLNSFQEVKQELPEIFWMHRPFIIGRSNILFENRATLAYLDYVLAKNIETTLPNFSAIRLSTYHTLYRSFFYKGLSFMPLVGLTTIFYSDSRHNHPVSQVVLNYQLSCDCTFKRLYQTFCHLMQPYAFFQGITPPTIDPDTPYIFSIQDGLNRINLLKTGMRNLFYFNKSVLFEPNIIADIYAYSFFSNTTFQKRIPKIEGHIVCNFPSWKFSNRVGWNIEHRLLEYANIQLAWTINEDYAFKTEFRYRSPFHWRKDVSDNFIMDVTRKDSDLLHSPLSDQRNVLTARLQMKISPQWVARLESCIGWGRKNEPSYTIAKVDLITLISTSWRLKITFIHSPTPQGRNNYFFCSLSLINR